MFSNKFKLIIIINTIQNTERARLSSFEKLLPTYFIFAGKKKFIHQVTRSICIKKCAKKCMSGTLFSFVFSHTVHTAYAYSNSE
jgi:hypothetical protein